MAITVYSKRFKRELDKVQLERLYSESHLYEKEDFRSFVYTDAECPVCNVSGAYFVSEGFSTKTKKMVRQAHFAFRKSNGEDAHKVFCDHYKGSDRIKDSAGEAFTNLNRKDNSDVTKAVRELVCRGIENNMFSQEDIRNMRQWFTELRESGTQLIDYSPHIVNLVRAAIYYRSDNQEYVFDINKKDEQWFNIDEEVYKSLSYKYPSVLIDLFYENNKNFLRAIQGSTITKQAHRLIRKDNGQHVYDRRVLNDKYNDALDLALYIARRHENLTRKFSRKNDLKKASQLLAVAALLLFISEWDMNTAIEKFQKLVEAGQSILPDAGNVIGMNPFIHYDAWEVVHTIKDLMSSLPDFTNVDTEFLAEKKRLINLFGLNEETE
ncbi:hypothetical protein ABEG70_19870 [Pantoea agglomerans]|uniref:hypothetical protein n=1 Tax=Enterobacter agglomerans TaxID=549 RepID=UPI00320A22A1